MVGPIRRDMNITDFEMSLLQGWAFALFYSVMALPIARLADRSSRKMIIGTGVALWSLMTAASGLAKNYGSLFAMRVGVGVGEAALIPPMHSLLSDYFSAERLPRAMAIYSLGIAVGGGLAFVIGGTIVEMVSNAPPVVLPVVGEIRSWQLTFFIVGLPGLLISALVFFTFKEPPRRGAQTGDDAPVSMMDALRYQMQRWRVYISASMGTALLGVVGYGTMAWYPTFLIRNHGLSVGEAGLYFGSIYIVFGSLGTLFGVRLAEFLVNRGYRDGHMRYVMIAAIALIIPATVGPLMPDVTMALAVLAPMVFIKSSYFGSTASMLQVITPNQIRAQISAMQIFLNNIVGMTVGASAIAALTDFVFVDDMAVKYSLAWVAAVACPLAAIILWTCLKPYRAALDKAAQWKGGRPDKL